MGDDSGDDKKRRDNHGNSRGDDIGNRGGHTENEVKSPLLVERMIFRISIEQFRV